jgi:hypothetical protein
MDIDAIHTGTFSAGVQGANGGDKEDVDKFGVERDTDDIASEIRKTLRSNFPRFFRKFC